MTGRLFIRTEASTQIGMGHFMRCFAIAEEARRHHIPVTFLLNEVGVAVAGRSRAIGAVAVPLATPLNGNGDVDALADLGLSYDDWLVIDSYKADADYIHRLAGMTQVCAVDDLQALSHYDCDLIVNAAQAAQAKEYGATRARLLLGANYALIRREFRDPPSPIVDTPFIAILFGGSDPRNLTGKVAEDLHAALPGIEIRMIAGPAIADLPRLEALAHANRNITLFPDPLSVARTLAGAELVLTAAGGSVGEVAAMALPALALVVYDNQKAALEACPFPVIDAREALPGDLAQQVQVLMDDVKHRAVIAAEAHRIVDGRGAARVVTAMFGVQSDV